MKSQNALVPPNPVGDVTAGYADIGQKPIIELVQLALSAAAGQETFYFAHQAIIRSRNVSSLTIS